MARNGNDVTVGCTVDREFVSQCNLAQYTSAIPNEYQVTIIEHVFYIVSALSVFR